MLRTRLRVRLRWQLRLQRWGEVNIVAKSYNLGSPGTGNRMFCRPYCLGQLQLMILAAHLGEPADLIGPRIEWGRQLYSFRKEIKT